MSEEPGGARHAWPEDESQPASHSGEQEQGGGWTPPPGSYPPPSRPAAPATSGLPPSQPPPGWQLSQRPAPPQQPGQGQPDHSPGQSTPITPGIETVRPAWQTGAPESMSTSVLATPAPETRSVRPPAPAHSPEPAGSEQPDSDSRPDSGPRSGPDSGSDSRPSTFPGSRRRSSSRRSRRGRLGAGLVEVPPVPYRDPSSAVLADPVVSEDKRFCGNCGAKVGRGSGGERGRAEGTCESCGSPYSFKPRLAPGELVGGQYEVLGALAYGGMGWIYLAQDHNVSGRWVVLKGLIDTGDTTALAAAVNETRFLAEVEHPNIVKIYNFVQHFDEHTGSSVGYIVMEYVGGQSLRQLALAHHRESGRAEPLPIAQVLAYGLEILPAIGYLHSQGLLYCDLKPDNVIQTHEQLKLIDLGAVRRMDDYETPLFFTSGYSAPELPKRGASIASDLFTVGRTLTVLSFEFTGYTSKYKTTLPGRDDVALFKLFDSYYRFLRRATHADPDRRFISAEDMADQLTGVLREILSLGTGEPRPGASTVFGPETRTFGVDMVVPENGDAGAAARMPLPEPVEVVAGLPVPQVDTDDVAAGVLAATMSADPREAVDALATAPPDSIEVRLRITRARIELGELAEANRQLQAAQYLAVRAGFPHDWRIDWYRGLIELTGGRPRVARAAFDAVYDDLPGEIAPKLALAVSAEGMGDYFAAARFYELVWRVDHSYVSAAFGLARVYLAQGGRASATEVLESVSPSSTHYVAAQVAAIKIKTTVTGAQLGAAAISEHDLADAAGRLERLSLDAERRMRLSAEVLEAAHGWVRSRKSAAGGETSASASAWPVQPTVLGCELSERELRFGLERCYRALARHATSSSARVDLVDKANAIRPRTVT